MQINVVRFTAVVALGLLSAAPLRAVSRDGSGMSTVWELMYGVTAADASIDEDGDGWTDYQESLWGTNPHDPNSRPKIQILPIASGSSEIDIQVSTVFGKVYQVETSPDFSTWSAVGPAFQGTGQVIDITTSLPGAPAQAAFFRLRYLGDALSKTFFGLTLWEEQQIQNSPSTAQNGIPDLWALLYGLDATDPFLSQKMASSGDMTIGQKFDLGLDPTKTDTDGDGVPDVADLYPTDPNRSADLPVLNYVSMDLSAGITNANVAAISIDDNDSVAFYYFDLGGAPNYCVVSGGAVNGPTAVATSSSGTDFPAWNRGGFYINGKGALGGSLFYYADATSLAQTIGFTQSQGSGQPSFVYFGSSPSKSWVSVRGFTNDGTLWGTYSAYDSTDDNPNGTAGYFIGSTKIPFTDPSDITSAAFDPTYVASASAAIGIVPATGQLAVWQNGSVRAFPAGLYAYAYAADAAGNAFGLGSPINSVAIHGIGASQPHPFYAVAGGQPVDAYALLPQPYINQVAFNSNPPGPLAMNNAGDVFAVGQTITGEGAGVATGSYLLWSPSKNQLSRVQLSNTGGAWQMNKDQLLANIAPMPLLDPNGAPVNGPNGSPTEHNAPTLTFQASFNLANPKSNDVMMGWESADTSSDHTAWTVVGVKSTNKIVALALPAGTPVSQVECVVNDADNYSANYISLQPVPLQSGNNNLSITGLQATSPTVNTVNGVKVAISQPARIVLRNKKSKQVLLTLNVMVLQDVSVTYDLFFCSDAANAASTLAEPYDTQFQQVANQLNRDLNNYIYSQTHVQFSLFRAAQVNVPGGFVPAGATHTAAIPGAVAVNLDSVAFTMGKYSGKIINQCAQIDTTDAAGTDPKQRHLRVFIVNRLQAFSVMGRGVDLALGVNQSVYCFAQAGGGNDPAYAPHLFNSVASHELGHALGLCVQDIGRAPADPNFLHDSGPYPVTEFKSDLWGTPRQTGLMSIHTPTQTYWLRHEDWQQANYYATNNLQ